MLILDFSRSRRLIASYLCLQFLKELVVYFLTLADDEEDVTYSALKISSQIISDEDRVKHIASLKEELAVQISTASKAYLKGLSKILKEESVPFRCLELLLGILKRCVKHPEISKLQGIKDLYDQYKATDADYLLNKLV